MFKDKSQTTANSASTSFSNCSYQHVIVFVLENIKAAFLEFFMYYKVAVLVDRMTQVGVELTKFDKVIHVQQ